MQFWDYRQPRKYLNILSCQVPVWKARYTVSVTFIEQCLLSYMGSNYCARPSLYVEKYCGTLFQWVTYCHACPQPFSNGLVTVMVPQLRRENSLLLWSVFDLNAPVHTFVGHDDVVLEFQWRRQKEGQPRPAALCLVTRDQRMSNSILVF